MSKREKIRELLADEERANRIRKAAEDVDEFIKNLPRKEYKDGWSQDKWEEEAEQHPLFMSKIDEKGELPPLVEALQSLKYDPEFNDPVEMAKAHKDDGNEQFKKQKYEFAVAAYSEGLKLKCDDKELNVVLYSNRAAALYHMGNYRKSLEDAVAAKTLKADHVKAIHRGALCCFQLGRFDNCISWCEEGLKLNIDDKTFIDLKKKARECIEKLDEKNKRKELSDKTAVEFLTTALKERGISIVKGGLTSQSLVGDYAGHSTKVELVNGELFWPVVLFYPQYGISDFIPNFNENSSFYDYFCELFREAPEWDLKKEYVPDKLKVYFCDEIESVYPVAMSNSLKSAMQHKSFKVVGANLEFFVTCPEYDKVYRTQNYIMDE